MEPITPIDPEPIIQAPVVNEPEPRNNLFKILFFVSLGLFLIILAVLIYFLVTTNKNLPEQNQIISDTDAIPIVTSIPNEIPTSMVTQSATKPTITTTKPTATSVIPKDWKTYTSTKYGFSFQYPKTLTFTSLSKDNELVLSTEVDGHWGYGVNIESNVEKLTLEKAFEKIKTQSELNSKPENISITNTIIGGNPAKRISIKNLGDYGNARVVLIVGNNIFTINGDDRIDSSKKEFETILSSFKFN